MQVMFITHGGFHGLLQYWIHTQKRTDILGNNQSTLSVTATFCPKGRGGKLREEHGYFFVRNVNVEQIVWSMIMARIAAMIV